MRAEHYGPAVLPNDVRAAREARGQRPVPPIAVVSQRCEFTWDDAFFTAATERPYIITVSSAADENVARAREVAEVIIAGDDLVDLESRSPNWANAASGTSSPRVARR
jgi:riboflavin biosynthesis pyrimidine reductase